MAWYVELHCDTPNCPHGSNEEGHQGRDKAAIAAHARRHGWRSVGRQWLCDGCAKDADAIDAALARAGQ